MLETVANVAFLIISFGICFFLILWYQAQREEKLPYPYGNSISGWISLAFTSPIKTFTLLFGEEGSKAKKDFQGVLLFSLILFTLSNFVYFRGHLADGGVLLVAMVWLFLFIGLRQYFLIKSILRNKSRIIELKDLYQQGRREEKELEKLKQRNHQLFNRAKLVEKVYLKWKKPYDSLVEQKEELEAIIEDRRNELNEQLRTLAHNIEKLTSLDSNTVLALDSNILMKADDYIFEEIQKYPIIISKRVQQEWDKNKSSDNQEKGYRARRAIRRLMKLPDFDFTVSKWNDSFLIKHNLMKGVPDDEIIADYLYEKQQGKNIVVLSDDLNFLASAKVHMQVLHLRRLDVFS